MKKMNILNYAMPEVDKKADKKNECAAFFGKEIEKFKEDPKAYIENVKNMDFQAIFAEDNVKKYVNDGVKAAHEALDKFQEKFEGKEAPKAKKKATAKKAAAPKAPKAKAAAKTALKVEK